MTWKDISSITDPMEAIKALYGEMRSVKSELSSCKSKVARLSRNNTKLNLSNRNVRKENKALKMENEKLKVEIAKLGGEPVVKDSTNSSVPPTQQSIKSQALLRTRSLRKSSGKATGGQIGHKGHSLSKTETPDSVNEHKVKVCPHCGCLIPVDTEQACIKVVQESYVWSQIANHGCISLSGAIHSIWSNQGNLDRHIHGSYILRRNREEHSFQKQGEGDACV